MKYELQIACFGFLFSVVETLYEKDITQYDLCDSGMYSREIINMFWLVKCQGLSKTLTFGFIQTPVMPEARHYKNVS